MKKPKTAIAISMLFTASIILVSAVSFADQKAEKGNKTTSTDVKRETREAIKAIENYSVEQRDKAIREIKVLIADLDARIDQMQSRIEKSWDELDQSSREKVRKTLKALREKRNDLSEWYGGLKHSSASAWDHVKAGFVEGYEALSNAFDKAESEFNSGAKGGKSGG